MHSKQTIIWCFLFVLLVVDQGWSRECGVRSNVRTSRLNSKKTGMPRIVGGEESQAGQWPWQALLEVVSESNPNLRGPICGGTLIGSKWVLSAAHCTFRISAENIQVHFGIFDFNSFETHANGYSVHTIINHPDYSDTSNNNDISLIGLAGEVVYTDYIVPACLPVNPTDDVAVSTVCWITGWGETQENLPTFSTLREAQIPVISNAQCQLWFNDDNVDILDNYVCAGFRNGGVDTCQGDSGGPLVCAKESSSAFVLHGVTSFGVGCARAESPGVYTRVTSYLEWITPIMQSDLVSNSFFAIPETPCGSTITRNGLLRLPLNSETQNYDPNTVCTWMLKNEGGFNSRIRISFIERFNLEISISGDRCFDYVSIQYANGNQIVNLGNYCGYSRPSDVIVPYTTASDVNMVFTSDSTVQYEGFAVEVSFESGSSTCDKWMTQLTDSLERAVTSPGFNNNIPASNDLNCEFEFIALEGFRVEVVLLVDTELNYDYLQVLDGTEDFGRISGDVPRTLITSSGRFLTLIFSTDGSISSRGFKAIYKQFQPSFEEDLTALSFIQQIVYTPTVNVETVWTIQSVGEASMISMHIYELGSDDVLEITDRVTSLGRLTGRNFAPIIIAFNSNRVTVRYSSNTDNSLRQISFQYTSGNFSSTCISGVNCINGQCVNFPAGSICSCDSGYIAGQGNSCEDINECETSNNCHANATCINLQRSFNCTCHDGFTGDGFVCSGSESTFTINVTILLIMMLNFAFTFHCLI